MNCVAALEDMAVIWIIFKCADEIFVIVQRCNDHLHSLGFVAFSRGILGLETKKEFHIGADSRIVSDFFRWWLDVFSVLCHPNSIFQVISVFGMSWKRVVLLIRL